MHLRGNVIYNTWENFWKEAYKSSYFRAQYDETSERTDWSLSERQLFTQSNGRTLLGQDTMGRLHSDAQFAGSSSVPAHVEMMGLIGMGNNPMVGATVAVAVAVEEAMKK